MQISFFDSALKKFIDSLEPFTIAKISRTIDLLERFGSKLGMPHAKKIDRHLHELRINGKQEVRILYMFHNETIILLQGFVKKSNKIPEKEIFSARQKLSALDNI